MNFAQMHTKFLLNNVTEIEGESIFLFALLSMQRTSSVVIRLPNIARQIDIGKVVWKVGSFTP